MSVPRSSTDGLREPSILIVDDDPGFGRVATELLTDRGYRVLGQVMTGGDALDECHRREPDVVLLDVNLPDVHGVSVATELSARPSGPRVVLTSTDRKAVSPDALRRSGARGFVPKTELTTCDLAQYLS